MATYNGARFVAEQLDSLAAQTRPPDEIIVVDDHSTDRTPDVVRDWQRRNPIPLRLESNEEQLGYTQNFSRALSLATGDIVFLSDQDDRWDAEKIETLLLLLESQRGVDVLLCDARFVDADLNPTGRTKLEQIRAAGMPEDTFFMGCCMAIRADFLERILPIPDLFPEHDLWIASIARALGRLAVHEHPLQDYRLHGQNQSRHPANLLRRMGRWMYFRQRLRESSTERLQASLKQRATNAQRLLDWAYLEQGRIARGPDRTALDRYVARLNDLIDCIDIRRGLLRERRRHRVGEVLRLSGKKGYRHFSGWKSLVRDVLRR